MLDYYTVVAGLLGAWFIKRFFSRLLYSSDTPFPPGPKPKPFIGNTWDLPRFRPYEVFVEWAKRYQSDLLYASGPGIRVLIINKLDDADELLDRRARKYSDRPWVPIIDLGFGIGWQGNTSLLRYGDTWRLHRKLCQQSFRAQAAQDFRPLLLQKAHEMLSRLLIDPDHFDQHSRLFSISVPMITMYGYEVDSFKDPCVLAAQETVEVGGDLLLPDRSMINIFPFLRYVPPWLPGATTRRTAERAREISKKVQDIPFEFVKKKVEEGTEIPSFVSRFLRRRQDIEMITREEEAVKNIAWTVYGGASDTTISATGSFFYLMAIYPEIQKKAQIEIDQVVGPHRLPNFEDRPSLPYIDALYREILRFKPPVPMALPHASTEDDLYKGYFIPKGTTILPNVWAMTRDEILYPEPLKFKPERFLDAEGNLNANSRVLAYGFGRRLCVGKYIASDMLWIILASVLAAFNITKCKDEFGNEVEIDDEYDDVSFIQHKTKFQCSFLPRSPLAKQLIEETK